jgi:hypothetical protein
MLFGTSPAGPAAFLFQRFLIARNVVRAGGSFQRGFVLFCAAGDE